MEENLNCYGYIKFSAGIAKKFGINEALVLAVIDKWINYHKEKEKDDQKKKHFIDGYWSTYITINEMQEQILVVSEKPIRNAVKHLNEVGVLRVSHHSRGAYRRTNWYSIDYDKLAELMAQTEKQNVETVDATETNNVETVTSTETRKKLEAVDSTGRLSLESVDLTALESVDSTETYIRINTIDNINTLDINSPTFKNQEGGGSCSEFFRYITEDLNSDEDFAKTIVYFLMSYTKNGYGSHPAISEEKILECYDEYYNAIERNPVLCHEDWLLMIDNYFAQNFKSKCDHKIYHFFTSGVLDNLYHHVADRAV